MAQMVNGKYAYAGAGCAKGPQFASDTPASYYLNT